VSRAVTTVRAVAWREVRTSVLVVVILLAGVIEVGLRSFVASGGAPGMISLEPLVPNPALAALYGRVSSLDNGGIFVVWKMGAFLLLTVAIWAALSATRLTRAHEDDGSWDIMVIGQRNRDAVLRSTTLVLFESGVVVGAVSWLVMLVGGQSPSGSAFFGLGVVATAWSGTSVGLLAAQVAAPRRAASQASLAIIVAAFFVRVVADANTSTQWLRDATFFGWVEKIGAFQRVDALALLPALVGPVLVTGTLWWLQDRRDAGGALWTHADSASPKPLLLGSTWTFAWRERSSVWRWWALGLAAFGAVLGYLTHALVSLAQTDPGYVALLDHWGLGEMVSGVGFVALASVIMSVAFTFLVVSWIASAASDEVKGRLDVVLATGPRRVAWLASVVTSGLLAMTCAAGATILTMWWGVRLSGTSMSLSTVAEAVASSLGVIPFMVGGSIWLVARLPRLAFAIGSVFILVEYIVQAMGPTLKWPALIFEADPFHYLRGVPVQSFNLGELAWVSLVGLGIGVLGMWRYARRDVVS
jgi:ABC-2 type transport system permease protein